MSKELYETLKMCWRNGFKFDKIFPLAQSIKADLTEHECHEYFKEMWSKELELFRLKMGEEV